MKHEICNQLLMAKIYIYPTLLVLLVIAGCTNMREPEFRRIQNLEVKNVGITKGTVGMEVTYFNPNGFGVTVKETEAEILLNNISLGKFVQDSVVEVQKNAEFSIPISGTVSLDQLLRLNLRDLTQKDIHVKASGTTRVGKMGVFVTKPLLYEGLHRLNDLK